MPEIVEATVIAVLSGDTLLVKSSTAYPPIPHGKSLYCVAILPIACAPALAIFSQGAENDPFALEALEHLRGLLQGRQVQLTHVAPCPPTFVHQTLGDVPAATFVVTLLGGAGEMVDHQLIAAGWARVRPASQIPRRFAAQVRHDAEEAALRRKIGVWGDARPRIDPMVAAQFDSVIVGLNRDFTFKLLEPPIDVELIGVAENPDADPAEFALFFGEYVLFQKAAVRILGRGLSALLVVSMAVAGHDLSEVLLNEGLALLNEITARHMSDVERFREPPLDEGAFQGTVTAVSNWTVVVNSPTGERRIVLASLHHPPFEFHRRFEHRAFDAWRFLRDAVLGKTVEVTLLGPHVGQLSVGGRDVSEMMLRAGVAELGISRIHRRPSNVPALIEANARARSEQKGIYNSSAPRKPTPYHGTVASILSPTELEIYMPTNDQYQLKPCALVNVQSEGNNAFIIQKAIRVLTKRFLHREVDVPNNGVIRDPVGLVDPRVLLIRRGLLRAGDHAERELLDAQEGAQKAERGIWNPNFSNETTHFNMPMVVSHILSPTRIVVQMFSDVFQQIQTGLSKLLIKAREPVKPETLYVMRVNWRTFRVVLFRKKTQEFFAVDYGFTISREMGGLFECPDDVRRIPPQCICCDLAYVLPFAEPSHCELVVKYMWNIFDSGTLYWMGIVKGGLIPLVLLREIPDGGLLQAVMLKDGAVKLDRTLASKTALPDGLEACEKDARRYNLGGWSLPDQ
jgi:endonuclease YncB( thermonuclease family)